MSHRPNILLITTDQQRGDCLGCDGHPVLETPYLDDLARRGCRFRHAYSSVPSCTPARAAILTGMDQWNHGRLTMAGDDYLGYPATLPGELGGIGYQTQAVGKMHFAPQRARYGFDHMVLDESGRRSGGFVSDYHQWFDAQSQDGGCGYRDHSLGWNSWMSRPTHLPEHRHPTHWTANEGIAFLKNRDPSHPFFLWLSFARPHSPYDPPKVYFDMYDKRDDIPDPVTGEWSERYAARIDDPDAPRSMRSPEETRRARAAYYGSITFIDHQIGRLLYELRNLDPDAAENTFILFTSDHGDMLGDHHHWRKTYAYEGSARVPMLMAYPESWDLPRGAVRDEVVEMRDIMPTLLEAGGAGVPGSVDGRSMLQLGREEAAGWREYIHGEHTECYDAAHGMQYVTDGREKYIWFHHTGKEQFFDLTSDPLECRDLVGNDASAARIDRWRKILARINEERGDPRGQNGKLVGQERALHLSPNYERWKRAGEAQLHERFN